jgi:hypothetical protein
MTTVSASFATNRSTPPLPPLIGLIGRPYVGKDTVAHYLIDRYRFVQCAFGDHIKLVAMQHYDPVRDKPRRSGRGRRARTA